MIPIVLLGVFGIIKFAMYLATDVPNKEKVVTSETVRFVKDLYLVDSIIAILIMIILMIW